MPILSSTRDELGPHPDEEPRAYPMQLDITGFFELAGIGWKMNGGRIVSRFDPTFEDSVRDAGEALKTAGRTVAATQLREAMAALSRRPEPNLSGAVFHAMAAFEALARDVTNMPDARMAISSRSGPTSSQTRSTNRSACSGALHPMKRGTHRRRGALR